MSDLSEIKQKPKTKTIKYRFCERGSASPKKQSVSVEAQKLNKYLGDWHSADEDDYVSSEERGSASPKKQSVSVEVQKLNKYLGDWRSW